MVLLGPDPGAGEVLELPELGPVLAPRDHLNIEHNFHTDSLERPLDNSSSVLYRKKHTRCLQIGSHFLEMLDGQVMCWFQFIHGTSDLQTWHITLPCLTLSAKIRHLTRFLPFVGSFQTFAGCWHKDRQG